MPFDCLIEHVVHFVRVIGKILKIACIPGSVYVYVRVRVSESWWHKLRVESLFWPQHCRCW